VNYTLTLTADEHEFVTRALRAFVRPGTRAALETEVDPIWSLITRLETADPDGAVLTEYEKTRRFRQAARERDARRRLLANYPNGFFPRVDCRNCGGDGFSALGGDCPACKGTGRG